MSSLKSIRNPSSKGYFLRKGYSIMYLPWRHWIFWLELQEPVQSCEETSMSRSVCNCQNRVCEWGTCTHKSVAGIELHQLLYTMTMKKYFRTFVKQLDCTWLCFVDLGIHLGSCTSQGSTTSPIHASQGAHPSASHVNWVRLSRKSEREPSISAWHTRRSLLRLQSCFGMKKKA